METKTIAQFQINVWDNGILKKIVNKLSGEPGK